MPISSFSEPSNWFWDSTMSSQTYLDNGTLILNCTAYRELNSELQTGVESSINFGYKIFQPHNSESVIEQVGTNQTGDTTNLFMFEAFSKNLVFCLAAAASISFVQFL